MRSRLAAVAIAGAAVFSAAACSPAAPTSNTASKFFVDPSGASGVTSDTPVERYFPLVDGTVYSYVTETAEGDRGLLIARVHRTDATHGELIFPTGTKRFELSPAGVRILPSGNFVLATPLAVGNTFRGQNGGRARIEDMAVVIDVRAGSFQGCMRVVEERGGDRPARFATTYCPDVGIVSLEAQAGTVYERAELQSAGPAVNLEKDGVTVEAPH